MQPRTLERLAWVLLYGGILLACLGAFVLDAGTAAALGWTLAGLGAAAVAAGVVAIWLRARR